MSIMICKSCGGEYSTATTDRMQYFHACPDSVPKVDRRDENVISTNTADKATMKSAGKGADVKV